MEANEIKKELYKQSPTAVMLRSEQGCYEYYCEIQHNDMPLEINFRVPIADMGDAKFHHEMEAKHLIRWILK